MMKHNKTFAITIIAVMSVLLIGALIWPLSEQRNRSIDRAIEDDFSSISSDVDDYYSDNRRLPDELDDLKLSDEVESRAKKYGYQLDKETSQSYELCANFRTDTTSEYEDDDIYFSSYYKAQTHRSGFDCIEYEVFGYYYDDFDSSLPFDGLETTEIEATPEAYDL